MIIYDEISHLYGPVEPKSVYCHGTCNCHDICTYLTLLNTNMEGISKLFHNSPPSYESPIIRFSHELHSPISKAFDLETPTAIFNHAVETYRDRRCVAFRKVIAHVLETRLLGDWQYYTYMEVGCRVKEMAAGLKKLIHGRKVQRLHMSASNRSGFITGKSQLVSVAN